jgi:hypothetical protein
LTAFRAAAGRGGGTKEANMSVAIVTYKVGVTRSHKPGPSRWLTLKLESAREGAKAVDIFFYEKEVPALGFLNRETSGLTVNLPLVDFEPIYDILQTEKPVFAHYRIHPSEHRLLSIDISTSEEPLGEGPVDTSP